MNHYVTLNIAPDATVAEIRKAYYKLAREKHPDKNPHNRDKAEEEFKKISSAYEVLSDPDSRANYNEYLKELAPDQDNENENEDQYQYQESDNIPTNDDSRKQQWEDPEMDIDKAIQLFNLIAEQLVNKFILGERLANAASNGYWDEVGNLYNQGAFLDVLSDDGFSALHYAVASDDFYSTQWLIRQGIDINHRDGYKSTALHHAAGEGNIQIFDYLVNNNAVLYLKNDNGDTPLHTALKSGKLDMALHIINNHTQPFWFGISNRQTIDLRDKDKNTPLHIALQKGYYNIADALLDKNARIDLLNNEKMKASDYNISSQGTRVKLQNNMKRQEGKCITM